MIKYHPKWWSRIIWSVK